jgi:hypothetical protein
MESIKMNKVAFFSFTIFLFFAEMVYADSLPPKIALDSKPMFLDLQECLTKAKEMLNKSDFVTRETKADNTQEGTWFGVKEFEQKGKKFYIKGSVKCVPKHKIILFSLASEETPMISLIVDMNLIFAQYGKLDWGQGNLCEDCGCENLNPQQ